MTNNPLKTSHRKKSIKIELNLLKSQDFSYFDLYESYLETQGLMIKSDSESSQIPSSKSCHVYPVFMKSIIERLEKYGQLAHIDDIGLTGRKRIKLDQENEDSVVDPSLYFYDLDDKFIDDTEIQNNLSETERDFEESNTAKFYVETDTSFVNNLKSTVKIPKKSKHKGLVVYKRDAKVDYENLPEEVRDMISKLKDSYNDSRQKGETTGFPKGSLLILSEIEILREKLNINSKMIDRIVAQECKIKLKNVKRAMEKLNLKAVKNKAYKSHKQALRNFENTISNESQKLNFSWSESNRRELLVLLQGFSKYVKIYNDFFEKYSKNPKKLSYELEEKKLIDHLKSLANTRLDDINLKERLKEPNLIDKILKENNILTEQQEHNKVEDISLAKAIKTVLNKQTALSVDNRELMEENENVIEDRHLVEEEKNSDCKQIDNILTRSILRTFLKNPEELPIKSKNFDEAPSFYISDF